MAVYNQSGPNRLAGDAAVAPPSALDKVLERLRLAAVMLLVAAVALVALATYDAVPITHALAVFVALLGAALVPWRLQDAEQVKREAAGGSVVETAVVRALVEGMPDPAVLLDRAGRVLHFNSAAGQLAPALRKNELAQFALRSPEIITALRGAIATNEPRRTTYLDHVPVDRWMELIVMPVAVPSAFGGNEAFLLMTFHDQTPLRRVEEMRADFVANASHELRTPLAALSGFIDTLQGPAREDAKARERFLAIMQTQASRMARLIDDLLSLSRVELSAHVRPDTLIDLVPIIREVVDGLEPLARDRQVEIELTLPATAVTIAGDREELLRVFENLIENALKYGASGGRVLVSLVIVAGIDGSSEVRVAVRDFGPGIAPEHLPRLTERFYRVDVGDSRSQGGTGLGLSLVKHIVNRHRGRLLIESVLKKGATFTACFPQPKPAASA
jgi:two-component system phosphate regulon sensor histidine kinase PhoR